MKFAQRLRRAHYALRSPAARAGIALDVVLLAAALAVLAAYWWPAARTQQLLQQQLEDTRRAVTTAMQANELLHAYVQATSATEAIERKLQASVEQAQLVQSLAKLARGTGVRIISESYEEGRRQADYTPLFLQVTLQGRYAGVRRFFNEVPTLPLWVEIQDIRVERMREPAGLLRAQVRLRAVRRHTAPPAVASS